MRAPVGRLRPVGSGDSPVADREPLGGLAQLLRSEVEQQGANFGRNHSHGWRAVRHGERPGGRALVGNERSVARNHLDAADIHIEFIGANLRHGRKDALAELHLADKKRNAAVRIDAQPRTKLAVGLEVAGQLRLFG